MKSQNEEIKKLQLEILSLCIDITESGNDAFYSYSAHVSWSSVRVCSGKWGEDVKYLYETYSLCSSFDEDYDDESIKIDIDSLKECIDKLKDILRGNV